MWIPTSTFFALLTAGMVRTAVDSEGDVQASEVVRSGLARVMRTEQTAEDDAFPPAEQAGSGHEAYWAEWMRGPLPSHRVPELNALAARLAGDSAGTRGRLPAGWTPVALAAPLVGISYKGHGSLPAGMAATPVKDQMLAVHFECKDPENPADTSIAASLGVGRLRLRTHWNPLTRIIQKKKSQYVGHLESDSVHVIYEQSGKHERPATPDYPSLIATDGSKTAGALSSAVGNCDTLEIKVLQGMIMDAEQIHDRKLKVGQQLRDAGYTDDQIDAGLKGFDQVHGFAAHAEKMAGSRPTRQQLTAEMDAQLSGDTTRKEIRDFVRRGLLKDGEHAERDYYFLSELYQAWKNKPGEQYAGYYVLGSGAARQVRLPQGKGKMAFEFVQDCTADGDVRFLREYQRETSPANCSPGKRGLVVLTGEFRPDPHAAMFASIMPADEVDDVMAGMDTGGFFHGSRLVIYLEK